MTFFYLITMITIIITLFILVIILGYTTFNLLKKNEIYEDITIKYEQVINDYKIYIEEFSNIIKSSDKKLKEIDAKGSFSSDDEIGFFFNEIKYLQEKLNNFKTPNDQK